MTRAQLLSYRNQAKMIRLGDCKSTMEWNLAGLVCNLVDELLGKPAEDEAHDAWVFDQRTNY